MKPTSHQSEEQQTEMIRKLREYVEEKISAHILQDRKHQFPSDHQSKKQQTESLRNLQERIEKTLFVRILDDYECQFPTGSQRGPTYKELIQAWKEYINDQMQKIKDNPLVRIEYRKVFSDWPLFTMVIITSWADLELPSPPCDIQKELKFTAINSREDLSIARYLLDKARTERNWQCGAKIAEIKQVGNIPLPEECPTGHTFICPGDCLYRPKPRIPRKERQNAKRTYFCTIYLPFSNLHKTLDIVKHIRKKFPDYQSDSDYNFDVVAPIPLTEAGIDILSNLHNGKYFLFSHELDKERIDLDFFGYSFQLEKYTTTSMTMVERYIDLTDRNKFNALLLIAQTSKNIPPETQHEIKNRLSAIKSDLEMWQKVFGMSCNPFLDQG